MYALYMYVFILGVLRGSINGGTPKWMIDNGKKIQHGKPTKDLHHQIIGVESTHIGYGMILDDMGLSKNGE